MFPYLNFHTNSLEFKRNIRAFFPYLDTNSIHKIYNLEEERQGEKERPDFLLPILIKLAPTHNIQRHATVSLSRKLPISWCHPDQESETFGAHTILKILYLSLIPWSKRPPAYSTL